jgi:hypothetical protein
VTPLQKVAMGLVLVIVDPLFGPWDGLPDPVGWGLVVVGLLLLRRTLPDVSLALGTAGLSGVVSAVLFVPGLVPAPSPSAGWALSLPELTFSFLLCASLAVLAERCGDGEAPRFAFLRGVFVALAVAPVLVYGGGLDALQLPIGVASIVANVYLVYLLFKVSRREFVQPDPSPAEA